MSTTLLIETADADALIQSTPLADFVEDAERTERGVVYHLENGLHALATNEYELLVIDDTGAYVDGEVYGTMIECGIVCCSEHM